jgi:hypothetical protein
MAKKRKTREQKILANLRHNFNHTFTSETSPAGKIQAQITPVLLKQSTQKTVALNSYPYLAKDLTTTAILTLGIFISQIILFTLLRNHVLLIPGISY